MYLQSFEAMISFQIYLTSREKQMEQRMNLIYPDMAATGESVHRITGPYSCPGEININDMYVEWILLLFIHSIYSARYASIF